MSDDELIALRRKKLQQLQQRAAEDQKPTQEEQIERQ
jgi:DNA-binding TFAR19-related protein (PDSD5 family)